MWDVMMMMEATAVDGNWMGMVCKERFLGWWMARNGVMTFMHMNNKLISLDLKYHAEPLITP